MFHKCDGCFYRTDWTSGTGIVQYPICEREWWKSLKECKAECEKPGECEFKLLGGEARRMVEEFCKIPLEQCISAESIRRVVEKDLSDAALKGD